MHSYRIFRILSAGRAEYTSDILENITNDYLPIAFYDKGYGEVNAYKIYERGDNVTLIVASMKADPSHLRNTVYIFGLFVDDDEAAKLEIYEFNRLVDIKAYDYAAMLYAKYFKMSNEEFIDAIKNRGLTLLVNGYFTIA